MQQKLFETLLHFDHGEIISGVVFFQRTKKYQQKMFITFFSISNDSS